MAIITDTEKVKEVLMQNKTVAVLGAHTNKAKAAYYVPRYLDDNGYKVYPVNPVFKDEELFGEKVKAALSDLETSVDVVDVFRRSEHLASHVEEILAMQPHPKVVWFQLGIRNDEVAKTLSDAGITVIQDRCMLADHQYLLD